MKRDLGERGDARREVPAVPAAMGVACVLLALLLAACGPRGTEQRPAASQGAEVPTDSSGAAAVATDQDRLITPTSIAGVRLGMTVDEARGVLQEAKFARSYDGDGMAYVAASLAGEEALELFTDEEAPDSTLSGASAVVALQTFSPAFRTREGVGPGSLVSDVMGAYGPIKNITLSEIEQRQYIEFERQPKGLTFRLDYTGVFASGQGSTTRCQPGARIQGVLIADTR